MSAPHDLVGELLVQSLAAWRVAGRVECTNGDTILISAGCEEIRIDRAPGHPVFRWMVTIDGRKRGAVSIVAVLRQVREAIDPGYAANRVRVAVAPLVPPQ